MTPRRAVLLLPVLAAARCGSPPPATLELKIVCGPGINPDNAGAPAPVAIRMYLLTAEARFQRADVFALTEREKATLADDVTTSEEIIVRPRESRTIKPELGKEVRFFGIAVLFRDIDRARWRAVAPLAPSGLNRLTLKVDDIGASLEPG